TSWFCPLSLHDALPICKGLGAPIGSCLLGTKEFIARAKRVRKLFGGSMRQGGIAAAGALFAFENNIDRLAEDHRNAQVIARAIADLPPLRPPPPPPATHPAL